MPFLSPKRRVSDAENKLRLLLCLRALGMATSDQLWPFVAELELMEYLPYCLLLDELNRSGRLRPGEIRAAQAYMENLGLRGFTQERTSAKEEYTPPFDLTGV